MAVYWREKAVEYARRWALGRNPAYLDFHGIGGDCTNFVSQCLYAGCGIMNYTPLYGWYYINSHKRTPSWTGVEYQYDFLVGNRAAGPYAALADAPDIMIGDVVQLARTGERFTHSALVVAVSGGELYVAAHTNDAWMRPLSDYTHPRRRLLHIIGVRE